MLFIGFAALLLVLAFSGGPAFAGDYSGTTDTKFRKSDDGGDDKDYDNDD